MAVGLPKERSNIRSDGLQEHVRYKVCINFTRTAKEICISLCMFLCIVPSFITSCSDTKTCFGLQLLQLNSLMRF